MNQLRTEVNEYNNLGQIHALLTKHRPELQVSAMGERIITVKWMNGSISLDELATKIIELSGNDHNNQTARAAMLQLRSLYSCKPTNARQATWCTTLLYNIRNHLLFCNKLKDVNTFIDGPSNPDHIVEES